MTRNKTFDLSYLRTAALIIALVGAVGSLYFMFNPGREQKSVLLLTLFTGATMISKGWADGLLLSCFSSFRFLPTF